MQRALLLCFGVLAAIPPAAAAPFQCPRVGGDLVFALEANINSLDAQTTGAVSTRNVVNNIFEPLFSRDDSNRPIPMLAQSVTESPDHLSYEFKLRQGVKFHSGKQLTSADVVASFDRYVRIGLARSAFDNVDRWDAPDTYTFVVHMKRPQPTFIDQISSFSVALLIIPAEDRDDPVQQLKTNGTGPFRLAEFVPGSYAKLQRFDGYQPNTQYQDRTGFGGYKQACLNSVTFRIVTEPGARVAGLQTGELQGVEDVPTKSVAALKGDHNIVLLPLENWWIQIALPNVSVPPTDNENFRRAVQAVLDMDEIMEAASDGNYRLNVGFQYPTQAGYSDAGRETYNLHNPALAKKYLAQSGYHGEKVILLTNHELLPMYNSALVMAEEMKSIGINAQLLVVDWPTSSQMALRGDTGWNFFFTGYGTPVASGELDAMQFLAPPIAMYVPKTYEPDLVAAWHDLNSLPDPEARHDAYVRMQKIVLDDALAMPFGALSKMQAVRSNVKNFQTFRIPRMWNVWLSE